MKHIITFAYFKNKCWGLVSKEVVTSNGIDATILNEIRVLIEDQFDCKDLVIPLSCIDVTEPKISLWHLTFLLDNCVNPYKPHTKYIHCTAETVGPLPSNILDKLVKRIREEEPDYKDYHLINSLETIKNIEPLKEVT